MQTIEKPGAKALRRSVQRSHTEGSRHSSDWLRRAGERVCRADQDRYPQPSRCGYRLNA